MDLLETFATCFNTLRAHKLRSFLTTLGIVIGVAAVLVNVAVVQGFSSFFEEQVKGLGVNFVSITAGSDQHFDEHIYESLSSSVYLESSTGSRSTQGFVEYMGESKRLLVTGVRSGYFEANNLEMAAGSGLMPQDKSAVVVSESMAMEEFEKPILEMSTIRIVLRDRNQTPVVRKMKVKGISQNPSGFSPIQPDLYIPISTFNDMTGQEGYSSISLFAESDSFVETVKSNAIESLDRLLKLEPKRTIEEDKGPEVPFEFGEGPRDFREVVSEEREEYTITTQDDVLSFVDDISSTINLLFIGIASVSLLVGGIGIANIMIVSVTERTREIGVMKAVGAKKKDILGLFLVEAGLIGVLGGFLGLVVSYLMSKTMVPALVGVEGIVPLQWVGLSIFISLMIGIISGIYPAFRASKMDPVEALSYE